MEILRNISLKKYNTFRIDHKADCLIIVRSEKDARSLFNGTLKLNYPLLITGSGSNILFTSDYKGTVICPKIKGIRIVKQEQASILISSGAGVVWDDLVRWSVDRGFGGLENLALIPGKVGAAPVQNIGAYGVEVQNTIENVRAVSITDGSIREFSREECLFGYRDSVFKNSLKNKYLITRVFFRLDRNPVLKTDYGSLREEVSRSGSHSLKSVREAVIRIRRSKLPDPELIGNAGSFFKNPVVKHDQARILKAEFPELPVFEDPSGGIKLAAGWLIEKCGWKGIRIGDAGVHEKQALVIVNYGNASGKEIYDLSERIRVSVFEKFGINLEREVEVIF